MEQSELQALEEEVRVLVAEHLNLKLDAVDLDMFIEEVANSLELSTLVIAAEGRFDVQLPDSALGRVRVLRDLAKIVGDARA